LLASAGQTELANRQEPASTNPVLAIRLSRIFMIAPTAKPSGVSHADRDFVNRIERSRGGVVVQKIAGIQDRRHDGHGENFTVSQTVSRARMPKRSPAGAKCIMRNHLQRRLRH
jgi:hypothetical protein